MKFHFTDIEEIKEVVLEGLRLNEGYCPCIINGKGKPQFKCPCEEFRNEIPLHNPCYCGLYIKDEQ